MADMSRLIALQKLIRQTGCQIRLKAYDDAPTAWCDGFGLPVEGYIEVSGPERITDVEWVELNSTVITHIGRLAPPKVIIVNDDIVQVLQSSLINYERVGGFIRIYGPQLVPN